MCDCEEIQGKWRPTEADFMFNTATEKVAFIRVNRTTDRRFKHHSIPYNKDRFFWLPRQDQLQEMISSNITDLYRVFWKCMSVVSSFERTPYADKCTSMEQLWLAFVMKEKFNKVWDGEKWIT